MPPENINPNQRHEQQSRPEKTSSNSAQFEQPLSPKERQRQLILELQFLGDKAENLRQSYLQANNAAAAVIPDFSAINKLDPANDLRWVNGALIEIQKVPVGDSMVDLAIPDAILTRLRGQIAKTNTLMKQNSPQPELGINGQINILQRLGEKAEVLRKSYLRAYNEATALTPDFSNLNKLDTVNDLRWANGAIEELNQIPTGNTQIDLIVPDRTVGQLRSLILKTRKLVNNQK